MTSDSRLPPRSRPVWLESLLVYRDARVAAMLFLGFSSGLPFALVAGTMAAWLARSGVGMTEVGMFAWVGILYAFKFAWAPLVDHVRLPLLTRWLGQRRSWMLAAQVGVAAALLGMASTDPVQGLMALAALAVCTAFCSATQDIAVDAWRIEAAPTIQQGALAAAYQLGYRVALLAATAGALFIGGTWSWPAAYQVMALLMGVGIVTTLLLREPNSSVIRQVAVHSPLADPAAWIGSAVIRPFVDFFERNATNALWILVFIGIYRISDMVLGVMANPFYLAIGFTELQIAGYVKTVGFAAVIFGAALGGVAVARFGLGWPLVFGAVILALTNLSFAVLAFAGPSVPLLVLVISADNIAQGFSGTVFIAYLSGLTNISYTATQYALFTSLMVLPGKVLSGFSGLIVEEIGWVSFFMYAAVIGVPAIFMAARVNKWSSEQKQ